MPRDLSAIANEKTLSGMSQISKSDEGDRQPPMDADPEDNVIHTIEKRNAFHPYTQTLSLSDVETCVRLEDAAFPPHERGTREKRPLTKHLTCRTTFTRDPSAPFSPHRLPWPVIPLHNIPPHLPRVGPQICSRPTFVCLLYHAVFQLYPCIFLIHPSRLTEIPFQFQYRLKLCGELCMGIFTSQKDSTLPTAETSAPVYSGTPERKAVLLGHIIATKTTNPVVTDQDMAIPAEDAPDPNLGHKEEGKTVCIHSLAVLPEYQKSGLGSTLMKAYIQRIESHGVADRIALIAHDHLIPWYEKLGFKNIGKSDAQFGGGGWYDMVRELRPGQTDA